MKQMITYELKDQAISISSAGIFVVPQERDDFFDTKIESKVKKKINAFFDGNYSLSEDIAIIDSHGDIENCLKFEKNKKGERSKSIVFFRVLCDSEKECVFSLFADLPVIFSKMWVNDNFMITNGSFEPLYFKLKEGENLFIIERPDFHPDQYYKIRLNSIENENRNQFTSPATGNLRESRNDLCFLVPQLPNASAHYLYYSLTPKDLCNISLNEKVQINIVEHSTSKVIKTCYSQYYEKCFLDLEDVYKQYLATPCLMCFEITYKLNCGNSRTKKIKAFSLFDLAIIKSKLYDQANILLKQKNLSLEEKLGLQYYLQEIEDPALYTGPIEFNNIVCLNLFIESIKAGKYRNSLYNEGSQFYFCKTKINNRIIRYKAYLPANYGMKKQPLVLINSVNFHETFSDRLSGQEDVIGIDITGCGRTMFSYIGEVVWWEIFQDIKTKFLFDENRVYTIGFSSGATAACNQAQLYPHLFAGVFCCGGIIKQSQIKNLSNLKFIHLTSTADKDYKYYTSVKADIEKHVPNNLSIIADNVIHQSFREMFMNANIFNALLESKRVMYPSEIKYRTEHNRHRRAYWMELQSIELGKTYAEMQAKISGNDIYIKCKNITGLNITIPPQINKKLPFRIVVNDSSVFRFDNCEKEQIYLRKTKGDRYVLNDRYLECLNLHKGTGLLDVYLDPLAIVPCGNDKNTTELAEKLSKPETLTQRPAINMKYQIIESNHTELEDCLEKSLIIIDNLSLHNTFINKIRKHGFFNVDKNGFEYLGKKYNTDYCIMQIIKNPFDQRYNILHIVSNNSKFFAKNVFLRKIILPSYSSGRHPYLNNDALILCSGQYYRVFDKGMKIEPINQD